MDNKEFARCTFIKGAGMVAAAVAAGIRFPGSFAGASTGEHGAATYGEK